MREPPGLDHQARTLPQAGSYGDCAMRIIRSSDYRRMPWKNGGGETVEVTIAPEGASLDAFDWRVSMARVASSGPFSRFPGVDRTLAVLAGGGMRLDVT